MNFDGIMNLVNVQYGRILVTFDRDSIHHENIPI